MEEQTAIEIVKSSGEKAKFSLTKLRRSLLRSGAGETTVDHIVDQVRDELYQGISTKEIYNRAFNLLKKKKSVFASKYKLTQISIPMGLGVKYKITDRINLGVDVGLRKTFTDYLDDVSGSYVNYFELQEGNGAVAAALGNRQGELLGEPLIVPTGTQRGNSARDDWYYNMGLTLSYTFNGSGKRRSKKDFGCPTNIY